VSKFKVGDVVRCVDSYGSVGALAEGQVYQVTDVGSHYGTAMLSVNNTPYIWYASRFELVTQELVNLTKDVDSYIPTSVAEYIEHLELREEALEQLVSDLTKQVAVLRQSPAYVIHVNGINML
jgi:hypothetical protein